MWLKSFTRRGMPVIVLAMALSCVTTIAGSVTSPSVKASAKSATVRIGTTVTITIRITHARNVGSAPFTLLYDPAILEFVGATSEEGGFLRQNRATTTFLAKAGPLSRGGGIVVGLSRLDTVRGAAGKGTLCRLTFKAVAPGLSQLNFSRAALFNPHAQPIDAVFTGTTIRVRPAS